MSAVQGQTAIIAIEFGKPRVEASVTVQRSGGNYADYHVSDRGWQVRITNKDGNIVAMWNAPTGSKLEDREPGDGLTALVTDLVKDNSL